MYNVYNIYIIFFYPIPRDVMHSRGIGVQFIEAVFTDFVHKLHDGVLQKYS